MVAHYSNQSNTAIEPIEQAPVPKVAHRAEEGVSQKRVKLHEKPRKKSPKKSVSARRASVLVLGMHRSGTSALTRVISLLGADLPSNLMPARHDNNETGFWESMDIFRLNDAILESGGSHWDDWRRFNPDWIRSPAKGAFKVRALQILELSFADSYLFVLKDPRNCRLMPFWLEVLREFETEPKSLLTIRNPIEVASSLRKRDGLSTAKSHMLWLRHVLEAEYATRGLKRAFVKYDSLLNDWRGAVATLSRELEMAWPRRSATTDHEIDRFVEYRHRHHAVSDGEISNHPEISAWVKEAYSALIELQAHRESKGALRRLDAVRTEFDRASDSLGAVVRSEEMVRKELEEHFSARIEELQRTAAERDVQNAGLRQALAERDDQIARLNLAVREKEDQIAEYYRTLEDPDRDSADIRGQLNLAMAEKEALLSSTSWLVTAPLRRLRTLLSGK
jgi:hypothetical protein